MGPEQPVADTTALHDRPDANDDVNAMLMVAPNGRDACPHAWLMGARFFQMLVTGLHPQQG